MVNTSLLPVSAVIATRHRAGPLARTLAGLGKQSARPRECLVVDASDDMATREVCEVDAAGDGLAPHWFPAITRGAASQRNEGVARATQPFVLFLDDDILPEPDCVARLWAAMSADPQLGGVNATITNQGFHPPGRASRLLYRLLDDHPTGHTSYAGRISGPGMNLLPEDCDDLPEVVPVEWLNTTCVLYRREALPHPPFPKHFTGYSMGEDLALSLCVAKAGWRLANARTARIFHDSQPGDHKNDHAEIARMGLVNRHYIMTSLLSRRGLRDYAHLALLELFSLLAALRNNRVRKTLPTQLRGKLLALRQLSQIIRRK